MYCPSSRFVISVLSLSPILHGGGPLKSTYGVRHRCSYAGFPDDRFIENRGGKIEFRPRNNDNNNIFTFTEGGARFRPTTTVTNGPASSFVHLALAAIILHYIIMWYAYRVWFRLRTSHGTRDAPQRLAVFPPHRSRNEKHSRLLRIGHARISSTHPHTHTHTCWSESCANSSIVA